MGMTSHFFTNSLRRRVAAALGDNGKITQSFLNNFWLGFCDETEVPDSNKVDKANEMVRIISQKPTADDDFLKLINEAFFIDSRSDVRQREPVFGLLRDSLLEAGFGLTDDGFTFPTARQHTQPPITNPSVSTSQKTTHVWNTTTEKAETGETRMPQNRDHRSVFIVHGRDLYNRDALASLLRKMDIKPLTWTDAAEHAKAHETLKIVEAGLDVAQAVIVLFTPDDEARLKQQFHHDDEPNHETDLTGQARPNVILEAGMAYAKDPNRTIFARIRNLRPISDIAGIHFINLDNQWESRVSLRSRLEKAGVRLDHNANLVANDAGTFGAATQPQ